MFFLRYVPQNKKAIPFLLFIWALVPTKLTLKNKKDINKQ